MHIFKYDAPFLFVKIGDNMKLLKNNLHIKKEDTINKSFQDWLSISEIKNNKIVLSNGKTLLILRVLPINFKLKSALEQNAIINAYKNFLKNLNSKIQIIISSKKTNIYDHIEEIFKFTKENHKFEEMTDDYINLIKQTVAENGSVTKEFYIVIEETHNLVNEELKIMEYLNACGNETYRINEDEIISLIKNFTNKRVETLV